MRRIYLAVISVRVMRVGLPPCSEFGLAIAFADEFSIGQQNVFASIDRGSFNRLPLSHHAPSRQWGGGFGGAAKVSDRDAMVCVVAEYNRYV